MTNTELLDNCRTEFMQCPEAQVLITYRNRAERLSFDERLAIIKALESSFAPMFLSMKADSRSLSDSDLLYCALSAERFDNIVIAEVLTISKDSVRMKKTRIREKLSPEWSELLFGEQKRNDGECCGKDARKSSATTDGSITLSQKEYRKLLKRTSMKTSVTFKQAVRNGLRNFANFNGRATRSEFWLFILFTYLLQFGIAALNFLGAIPLFMRSNEITFGMALPFLIVDFALVLAIMIPSFSVSVRRLHDSDHSGRWMWLIVGTTLALTIVPIVIGLIDSRNGGHSFTEGSPEFIIAIVCFVIFYIIWIASAIYMLYLAIAPGTEGPNNYGADPRAEE